MFRSRLPSLASALLLSFPAFAQVEGADDPAMTDPGSRPVHAPLDLADGLQGAGPRRGVAIRAAAQGDPKLWITAADYPDWAVRAELEGNVLTALTIDAEGRVSGCEISLSSGAPKLDAYSCELLMRRARFTAARGRMGRPVADVWLYSHGWKLPVDRAPPVAVERCADCGLPWTAGGTEVLHPQDAEPARDPAQRPG